MDVAEWARLWTPVWIHITSRESWLFVSQVLQGFGQALAVLVAFYALWTVQYYTKKKDRADFIRNRWNEQAQVNLACLTNDDALRAHEEMIYGRPVSDIEESRKFFIIFCILNNAQHLYIAYQYGVLSTQDFENFAIQSVRLLKRNQATAIHLLMQRGYTQDFRNTLIPLFDRAIAPEFPASLNESITPSASS